MEKGEGVEGEFGVASSELRVGVGRIERRTLTRLVRLGSWPVVRIVETHWQRAASSDLPVAPGVYELSGLRTRPTRLAA
ncbi:MAG: hypothetical protein ACYSUI_02430 [Planctomycetota bacterium]|jgi:hypothetical protein